MKNSILLHNAIAGINNPPSGGASFTPITAIQGFVGTIMLPALRDKNFEINVTAMAPSAVITTSGEYTIISDWENSPNWFHLFWNASQNGFDCYMGGHKYAYLTKDEYHDFKITRNYTSLAFYADGTIKGTATYASANNNPVYLFRQPNWIRYGQTSSGMIIKHISLEIDGTMICDLNPVIDSAGNALFYDKERSLTFISTTGALTPIL